MCLNVRQTIRAFLKVNATSLCFPFIQFWNVNTQPTGIPQNNN
jgi:hypothetical protein